MDTGGDIAAHYASQVFHVKYKDRTLLSAFPCDIMANEKYRIGIFKYKLFPLLMELGNNFAMRHDISFGIGFPTPQHYASGKRFLAYKDLFQIQGLATYANWAPVVREKIDNRLIGGGVRALSCTFSSAWYTIRSTFSGRGIKTSPISRFGEEFDELWERAKDRHKIINVRDSKKLNWRFSPHSGINYLTFKAEKQGQLAGYVALRIDKRKRKGYLMDLFAIEDEMVIQALVERAMVTFAREEIDVVSSWMLPRSLEYRILTQKNFVPSGEPIPGVFLLFHQQSLDEGFYEPSNWYLTYADFDHH